MKEQIKPGKRNTSDSAALFREIRELILSARKAVVRNVDSIQVIANFEIGRRIINYEQQGKIRAEYGEKTLTVLSDKLTLEFGRGYSKTNLKLMRQFYLVYGNRIGQMPSDQFANNQKSQMLSGKLQKTQALSAKLIKYKTISLKFILSWSQYVFLMGIKDKDTRNFYEIEAANNNWTLPELERQFNSGLYERLALSRNKEGIRKLAKEGQIVAKPEDLLKQPYVLEFLGIDEKAKFSESDLESAIIDKLEHFLLELGKGFLFEARQKRFTFDEDHFFVDLVFYNRLLNGYVLIDLKIGKLTHQDLGQMQMYVNYFDRHVKTKEESSTIGIILCRKNREALVEITLPKGANIHAKEYQLYLPSKEELKRKLIEWSGENK
ncbi:MAG: PDDEXK nuclease domain-containing protein [Elusimicrobia bacterium]|nr:PDDEXK nuclease domain-containing protein [Candidatus Liberimonas magnetica]